MKKLFFIGLAATAMLASCTNDETVDMPQGKAIGFSNAFVNNSTRAPYAAGYSASTLPATIEVFGSLFNGKDATWIFNDLNLSNAMNWEYSPLQYWVAGNDYKFYALAPADAVSTIEKDNTALTSIRFVNDGKTDLLYSSVDRSGNSYNEDEVAFTFDHLLSKVKFSMINGFASELATIKVSNIVVSGLIEAAIYNFENETWSSGDASGLSLNFGNIVKDGTESGAVADAVGVTDGRVESNYERFFTPNITTGFTVSFTAELSMNNVVVGTYDLKTDLTNIELEKGKSYNFIATLKEENITGGEEGEDLKPIKFTVQKVNDWENGKGWDVTAGEETANGEYNGGTIVTSTNTTSTPSTGGEGDSAAAE